MSALSEHSSTRAEEVVVALLTLIANETEPQEWYGDSAYGKGICVRIRRVGRAGVGVVFAQRPHRVALLSPG